MWFSSVQSLGRVQLFATPQAAAHQASLSITNSRSLLKFTSIESVMPSNHLILCRPLLLLPSIFPSIRVFSNESALHSGGQSIGVSASASVLPMNIQDWFPLGWTEILPNLNFFKKMFPKPLCSCVPNHTTQSSCGAHSERHRHTRVWSGGDKMHQWWH